jgi:hypothetical protein
MNNTVTAKGMQISAKTDSVFLQIVAGTDTSAFLNTEAQTSADASATTPNGLKATHVCTAFTSSTLTDLTTGKNTGVGFATGLKFVEAFSNDPSQSKGGTMNYQDVTSTAKGNTKTYTLLSDFRVRLNPSNGTERTAANFRVDNVDVAYAGTEDTKNVMLESVRVLIVCGEQWTLWSDNNVIAYSHDATVTGAGGESTTLKSILADTVTAVTNDAKSVQVYVYFDGEVADTTTNNAAKLGTNGYKVEVSFMVD